MSQNDDIKAYWEERARQHEADPGATTDDVYLRALEAKVSQQALVDFLGTNNARVLDVGCGDGHTTLKLAGHLPQFNFTGLDYSANMIRSANARLAAQPSLQGRVQFAVGDAW
jgi:ubiquinone/menaquinone biosynthesis C-methylase UbiE